MHGKFVLEIDMRLIEQCRVHFEGLSNFNEKCRKAVQSFCECVINNIITLNIYIYLSGKIIKIIIK